jgi:signal transduction histidine kinase
MSTTLQIIIAVSLVIIAIYFLLLTVLTVIAYLKLRVFQRYLEKILKERLEIALEHLQNITVSLEDLSTSTTRKVEDLTEVIPEIREKMEELVDLLDLVQEKLRNPLLNLVSALKVFSQKVTRWL